MNDGNHVINPKVWVRLARKFPTLREGDSMFGFWFYLVKQRDSKVDAERDIMTCTEEELDLRVMLYKLSLEPEAKWTGFKNA